MAAKSHRSRDARVNGWAVPPVLPGRDRDRSPRRACSRRAWKADLIVAGRLCARKKERLISFVQRGMAKRGYASVVA